MAGWTTLYQERTTTPDEAVRAIKSGHRVFLTGNCSVPQKVLAALVAYAPNVRDVEIVQVLTVGNAAYVEPGMQPHLRVNTLFISDNVRAAVNALPISRRCFCRRFHLLSKSNYRWMWP